MGVDCSIKVADGFVMLDRWWVFSDHFDTGEIVSQGEALDRLCEARDKAIKVGESVQYRLNWIKDAEDWVRKYDEVTFVSEPNYPDDWYENVIT